MRGPRRLLLATLPVLAGMLLSCGSADDPGAIGDIPADDADQQPADGETDEEPAVDDALADEDGADDGRADDGRAAGNGPSSSDSRELTLAAADAADRTGLATDDIAVVEHSRVTWPDGALGCPEPGTMYTQALVDGYRIVLDADGEMLVYHGALGSDPFHCQSPQEPVDPIR